MVAIAEQSIQTGNLTWFYRQAEPMNPTQKPPVVCLHGLPSQGYSWRQVLPALAEQGFWAIAPDWIGMGFSDKPNKRDFAYTPDAYVAALADFLAALEIDRCFLVAQGFLGSVGVQYALRHPDQIERLAIFNVPISAQMKLPWRIRQLGLPLAGEMFTQDPLLVDRTLEGGGFYRVEDEDLDVYRRPFLKSSAAGRSLFIAVRNLQLKQALPEIEAGLAQWQKPTLVAWGVEDPWLPVELAEAIAQTIPEAEFERLEQVGHYPQEDWYEKVNDVLLQFLRRQLDI
ncbi:MAG: alpha/beta fold hydrolase [Elainellaceae cyanobacterium]